ncbi:hypothetical protein [Streptomyces sp. NPDC048106]|uniref:hypothetical protein n=1 Tax=Streptomyces sp. NPDC048106 TaxID=3155750 RepID=UPI003451618C
MTSGSGPLETEDSRHRNRSFEPESVEKRQRRGPRLEAFFRCVYFAAMGPAEGAD